MGTLDSIGPIFELIKGIIGVIINLVRGDVVAAGSSVIDLIGTGETVAAGSSETGGAEAGAEAGASAGSSELGGSGSSEE